MNKESMTAIIHTGDNFGYVAECIEIGLTQELSETLFTSPKGRR
ncbi:hypothetical protein [Nodularia spumigena]|nr:hypothetical protein [Nodularia spumigena]